MGELASMYKEIQEQEKTQDPNRRKERAAVISTFC